jgi:glutathione S-transferase kappa 1
VFLGGVNVGSGEKNFNGLPGSSTEIKAGNKPPWTLPAKAAYSKFDGPRAAHYFAVEPMKAPEFFPIMTLLVCASSIKILQEWR